MISFSVVIRTHQREDSLRRAIESVLNQTSLPSQIVVINDNGDPLPPDIAQKVREKNIEYIQKDISAQSAPTARNEGMKLASGDVLILMDDDVELYGDTIERFYQIYKLDIIGCVGCVGASVIESKFNSVAANKLWWTMAGIFGQNAWCSRLNVSRYVPLSTPLKKMIKPARRFSGSLITMRAKVAKNFKFDDSMTGYALGEDREFVSRTAGDMPIFIASDIKALHHSHPHGRPGSLAIGKSKLSSLEYIARKTHQYQAGSRLVIWYEILGMMTLHFIWSIASRRRRNLYLAAGIFFSVLARTGQFFKAVWKGESVDG